MVRNDIAESQGEISSESAVYGELLCSQVSSFANSYVRSSVYTYTIINFWRSLKSENEIILFIIHFTIAKSNSTH